jgi:hypothetical protein
VGQLHGPLSAFGPGARQLRVPPMAARAMRA